MEHPSPRFLADRTIVLNGRAYATMLRPSSVAVVVCNVMSCGYLCRPRARVDSL